MRYIYCQPDFTAQNCVHVQQQQERSVFKGGGRYYTVQVPNTLMFFLHEKRNTQYWTQWTVFVITAAISSKVNRHEHCNNDQLWEPTLYMFALCCMVGQDLVISVAPLRQYRAKTIHLFTTEGVPHKVLQWTRQVCVNGKLLWESQQSSSFFNRKYGSHKVNHFQQMSLCFIYF